MKKFIFILILTVGFVYEGKAQFPASSEIYAYIQTDFTPNSDGSVSTEIYYAKFYSDRVVYESGFLRVAIEMMIEDNYDSIGAHVESAKKMGPDATIRYLYNSRASTDKYYAYLSPYADREYVFFSKDRSQMIKYHPANYTPFGVLPEYKHYYKRISISDLKALVEEKSKPNLDFLE